MIIKSSYFCLKGKNPFKELRSPRHQGVSPSTNSPPRNDLATSQLATKRSLLATNDPLNKSNTKPQREALTHIKLNMDTL